MPLASSKCGLLLLLSTTILPRSILALSQSFVLLMMADTDGLVLISRTPKTGATYDSIVFYAGLTSLRVLEVQKKRLK